MTATTTNGTRVSITSEPMTYRVGGDHSYMADLVLAEHPERERGVKSRERLLRHEHELGVELRTTTATYGDPPLWLVERFATYPRPERILLDLIDKAGNLIPIPQKPGFSSVNLPRLTTGTSTSVTSPGGTVADVDIVDTVVPPASADRNPETASRVVLIAGDADLPLPMLEQSGAGAAHYDAVLWKDLSEDYDAKVEYQLLNGTGGTGAFAQLLGLLNVTGVNGITYTDATPTAAKMVGPQATQAAGGAVPQAVAAIGNNRKRKPEFWLMTSSRAAWIASQEIAMFPLAVSNQTGPGEFDLLAYPVVENDSIPTNLGTGGNQDTIVCFRPSDLLVFESEPTLAAHTEVLSGTLEARVQLRRHVGAVLGRYPSGISAISGTGMAVQTALGF